MQGRELPDIRSKILTTPEKWWKTIFVLHKKFRDLFKDDQAKIFFHGYNI